METKKESKHAHSPGKESQDAEHTYRTGSYPMFFVKRLRI